MVKQESKSPVPAAKERLEQAREKFSEVAEAARRGGAQVKEKAGRAGAVAKEKVGVATESLKQGYDKVHKDLDKLSEDVTDYVRHNPGRSVLMAAGLGFLIGILVRGRRH